MFKRSDAGLENQHMFYDVDLVIYCEGRKIDGEGSSLDEVFWNRAFMENGRRVECKSAGSKSDLTELANLIIEGDLDNVAVCMDRDYDDLSGALIYDRRVIYTLGYSWENDAVAALNFEEVIHLFAVIAHTKDIKRNYEEYYGKLSSALRRIFALDYKYIDHDEALFDRQKPLSIVDLHRAPFPKIRKDALLQKAKSLGRFQSGAVPSDTYRSSCGVLRFYGKTVIRILYHWFVKRTSSLQSSLKVSFDVFQSILASRFSPHASGSPVAQHYQASIAAV